METLKLKRFAQFARRSLLEQVSAKLKLVLAENSDARRESTKVIKKLEEAIKVHGKEQVIERVAYIWFNRFCALRFMDVKRYNRINIVSPSDPGQFQPEILAEAKMGHINEEMVHDKVRQQIFALLEGKAPSRDPQTEAYRLLVVAACNFWNKAMPFLFERIDDYTELLMPEDMLSGNSILTYTREAMTPVACEDVEVIGWLYQFYISEKKDQVFDDLKKNKKITPENIPAATQLFTPHWIVRYLVENSLGRLWMLNRPNSKLIEQMEYYIKPEQPESDFLRINKPEEIKICDPACGSGHMLTYAFDLLYAVYEEEGYEASEIPEKILTHNLYGIEIDERAGELAAFALTMKARARQPRFFRKPIQPNICVLQNVLFDDVELKNYMDFIGRDLFTAPLQSTLKQFEEADNFGSLIRPVVTDVAAMLKILEAKNVSGQLFLGPIHQKALQALRQADYLSPKYHVVIANPPYMGGKGMNCKLAVWLKENYSDVKSDLFSAFVVRCSELGSKLAHIGIMSPNVWMYLSSYEDLRNLLLRRRTINCLVELPLTGFKGATVQICAYTFTNTSKKNNTGQFIRLVEFKGGDKEMSEKTLEAIHEKGCYWLFTQSTLSFSKVPGSPIVYWISDKIRSIFMDEPIIGEQLIARQGLRTGDNERFIRFFWEISVPQVSIGFKSASDVWKSEQRWVPINRGGAFRRWYGNTESLIAFARQDRDVLKQMGNHLPSEDLYFKPMISWSDITSSTNSFRHYPQGFLFDGNGHSVFPENMEDGYSVICYVNNKFVNYITKILSPGLHFDVGYFRKIPLPSKVLSGFFSIEFQTIASKCILYAKSDWDFYETSWDFTSLPLLQPDYRQPTLIATYINLRAQWREMTLEMQRLEEENNCIFINAYGLQDELTPDVPLNEITLTCNPHYRYNNNKNAEELEALLLADTMKEFISYAVGCMFGRYSLDKPGLILANQGDTITEYLREIPDPTFQADEDNIIPILDGEWFTDDISERFRKFLRITFGEEHYEENLKFIEVALGKDIRKYFLKDFYNDHWRRYKKRPIYWLFSSPKSFNALIYMHRYRPDTASVVLRYLREFRIKLLSPKSQFEAVSINASASPGEKTKALKEIESLRKMIEELESYEREILYPLATEQLEIDLDDGVKVNYQKFGPALKKIPGLDAKEE